MPYANSQGVRIYYEVKGQGPPLVMAHGGGSNLNGWRRYGYTDALKNDYKLVLFDARAHGRSDKPHEMSAYGPKMANDVVAVLDDLGISKTHFLGYSTGALTGYLLAVHHADRFYSIIMGCMSPYGFPEAIIKVGNDGLEQLKLFKADPEGTTRQMEARLGRPLTHEYKNQMATADVEAMTAILTAQLDVQFTEEEVSGTPCHV
jgi:pimeloyl-ACP methyl ester carboxylesterase